MNLTTKTIALSPDATFRTAMLSGLLYALRVPAPSTSGGGRTGGWDDAFSVGGSAGSGSGDGLAEV